MQIFKLVLSEKVWKVVEEDEDDETDTEPGMNGKKRFS